MLITRTPLRISIGGGGTDLPSFYRSRQGFVISAAINKYMFIGLNRTFTDDYLLKYSGLERRRSIHEIDHAIVREVFREHDVEPGIEMVSLADIPSGTGLGSSGAFTVGLLRAIYALKREHVTASALAEEACHVEIDLLGEPVGKQDQYSAAFGGLTCFEFHSDDRVTVSPLAIPQQTLHDLEERLLLFFTGYARSAGSILEDQTTRSERGDALMLESLEYTKALGAQIREALEGGRPGEFGRLMHEHWERKRGRSAGMSNERIDHLYRVGLDHGALGGKLVGAGAGGFLMFYAEDQTAVRAAMAAEGLRETRFAFDLDGSTVSSAIELGMPCVILAGGLAARLAPLSDSMPKTLLPIKGRPFADHQLGWLAAGGVTDVVYAIGHLGDQVRAFAGDGSRWGLRIAYVDEGDRLRGTAGALRLAYDHGALESAFLVLYGDSYLSCDVRAVWREFEALRPAGLMTVFRNEGRFGASNAQLRDGAVVRYDKGVSDPEAEGMRHIDYGLSILDREAVIPGIPPEESVDLAHVYARLSSEGRLAAFEVHERFYEIGSRDGLAELEGHLASAR